MGIIRLVSPQISPSGFSGSVIVRGAQHQHIIPNRAGIYKLGIWGLFRMKCLMRRLAWPCFFFFFLLLCELQIFAYDLSLILNNDSFGTTDKINNVNNKCGLMLWMNGLWSFFSYFKSRVIYPPAHLRRQNICTHR